LRGAPTAAEAQPRRPLPRGGAPTAAEAQPRRRRRADGPRTIVPLDDAANPAAGTDAPFAFNVDAARERLRRAIPPVADDER
ncbi:MAG TPA: hypothetical protein VGO71_09880, partial [Baekduia sp.]|nr:hypothetical protein [Baekduia sp.]